MKRAFSVVLCSVLAACGGGSGGGGSVAPTVSKPTQAKASVQIKLTVPSIPGTAPARLRRAMSAAGSAQGAIFTVYAHGGSPSSPITQAAFDITSTGGNCSPSGSGRVCTLLFEAPTGSANDLLVQTLDAAPVGGVISTGNVLSAGTIVNLNVVAGQTNSFGLTLNPVATGATITLPSPHLRSMLAATQTIGVNLNDADGNVIVSGSYVDLVGNPVTVNLSASSNPNNSLTFTPSSVTASGTTVTLAYNGQANLTVGSTTGVTITAAGGAVNATAQLYLHPPSINVYALNHEFVPTSSTTYYGAIYANVNGTTPQIWMAGTDVSGGNLGGVEMIDLSTHMPSYVTGQNGDTTASIVDANGTAYVGTSGASLYQFPYSPSIGSYGTATCSGASCANITGKMAFDGSLNLAFVANGHYSIYSTSMGMNTYFGTVPTTIAGLALDPSNNAMMVDAAPGGNIYYYNGSIVAAGTPPSTPLFDIVYWPSDGAYIATSPSDKGFVGVNSTPGIYGEAFLTGTPRYIYADKSGNPGGIYVDETLPSGHLALYRATSFNSYKSETDLGIAGANPGPITAKPDGSRLYIVNYTSGGGQLIEVVL